MIRKNGVDFQVLTTTIAASAITLLNLTTSSSILPFEEDALYSHYSYFDNVGGTQSLPYKFPSDYLNVTPIKNDILSLFDGSRNLNEDEIKIYRNALKKNAIKTGKRLF